MPDQGEAEVEETTDPQEEWDRAVRDNTGEEFEDVFGHGGGMDDM